MPTRPSAIKSNHELFDEYIMKLHSIVTDSSTVHCVIMGNLDSTMSPNESGFVHHLFGRDLINFCESENLITSDVVVLSSMCNIHTHFNESHGSTSWLDHIRTTSSANESLYNIKVLYDYVTSDHLSLSAIIHLPHVVNTDSVDNRFSES